MEAARSNLIKARELIERLDKAGQHYQEANPEDRERAACIRHNLEGHELSDRCKSLLGSNNMQTPMKINHNIQFPEIPGVNLYLVGGAVRDFVMGKQPKDNDFVMLTNHDFNGVLQQLQSAGVRIYQTKPEFQIILIGIPNPANPKQLMGVDLAFPRKEGMYSDGRRPDTTERTNDLRDDAGRRDFTINSMFMDKDGNVIDYYNGMEDIKLGRIRAVGDPDQRFQEDALRIIRAMRFACKLGFEIEPQTRASMARNMQLLLQPSISMDRIRDEVTKMLNFNPDMAMKLVLEFGLNSIMRQKDAGFTYTLNQTAASTVKKV